MENMTSPVTQVVKYSATEAQLEELKLKYEILPDPTTPKGYRDLKTGIAEIRQNRTGIEKERKALKADALEYGRRVDAEAKRITEKLLEIEEPMKKLKQEEDERREKIKREKEEAAKAKERAIEAKAEAIRDIYRDAMGKDSEYVAKKLIELESMEIKEADFEHMTERAVILHGKIVDMMKELLAKTTEQERVAKEQEEREAELKAKEAELEKQRLEQEALERKQREEEAEKLRIQKETTIKALQEAEAKYQAEQESKRIAEKEEAQKRYDVSKDEAITKLCRSVDHDKAVAIFDDIENGRIPHVTFSA